MDAKDLRIETALGAQSNDGSTKYAPNGPALQTNGNKPYQDIGSNSLAKVDVSTARPCAIIGPDRVVPPHSSSDVYLKKAPVEPWPCANNIYQQPPEYPHKPADYPPSRNISPRQTFQENMQRIMVPPVYGSVKSTEDNSLKNSKLMPSEAKYCDVPYTISPINNEPKIIKNPEGLVPNNNSAYIQPVPPQGWLGSGVNVRPIRPYGAPEFYQYSEFPNCSGPRPISMIRPHRNMHEDVPQVYQDRFYPAANVRFKPYPNTKERHHPHPQARYEYITNYPNTFHLHSPYTHKYDLQKSMPPHPCPVYPTMPLKYLDKRMPTTPMDRYQRSPNQQMNLNPPFCNQNIPPSYGSVPGNSLQNRAYPYSPDPSTKPMIQNRLYFDNSNTHKYYPTSENMYINDFNQPHTMKNELLYPSYAPINVHTVPHHMYRKENAMKGYENSTQFRNFEYSAKMNPMSRLPLQFSPQTISISPDSNTSIDTIQTLSNVQEDCGYVSQSSTASVKSIESGVNRMSSDLYRHHDMRFETISHVNKSAQKLDANPISKDKKGLDVRQFLQMWNEGDDEANDSNKETSTQMQSSNTLGHCETGVNQEQLYVLGLVNVPNEELDKYDHIQKISKLPENIKGYNNIELLNQYEKLVESPRNNHFNLTAQQSKQKDVSVSVRNTISKQGISMLPRPISPLDVEAKISQSVIHKEVGCNFEIRPCSPQMMNVEVATPVHNILGERLIEKVVNPVITKSPMLHRREETINDVPLRLSPKVQSCKMVNTQYPSPNISESLKPNYCLQDLESNSGVGLASLPRLDNDIELNFPEINQQFINANKIESVTMTSIRDLPVLDTENSNSTKSKIHNKPFISENLNSGSESDKEVSKLSKYRKHKKSISINRTDSVIIKNPETVRSQEEYSNTPLIDKPNGNPTVNPIIELQNDRSINCTDQNFNETLVQKFDEYATTTVDTAIDFSFNKNYEQGTYINTINNLPNPLDNNNVIDKNLFPETEVTVINAEKPKKLIESCSSLELNSIQLDSPVLSNFTCADKFHSNIKEIIDDQTDKQINPTALKNKIGFESIDDDKLILPESPVILLKAKENIPTEILSQQKDLPILSQDDDDDNNGDENALKNMKSKNSIIALSNLPLNYDFKCQAVNHCFADVPNKLSPPPIHKPNNNLTEVTIVDQNNSNNIKVKNNITLENDTENATIFLSTNEVVVESNDPEIEKCHDAREINLIKSAPQEDVQMPEENFDNEIDIPATESKTLVPIKYRNDKDSANLESYLIEQFNSKCINEDYTSQISTKISNDITDIINSHELDNDNNLHNIELTSKSDLESPGMSEMPYPVVTLVNNESVDERSTENEYDGTNDKVDSKIINVLDSVDLPTVTKYYQNKNESFFKKELFSPWFQNLLLHIDGLCTPSKSNEEKCIPEVNNCNNTDTCHSHILPHTDKEDFLVNVQVKENISSKNSRATEDEATSIEVSTEILTDMIFSETVPKEHLKPEVQECNIGIDTDEVSQNEIINNIRGSIDLIENDGIDSNATESLIELVEVEENETVNKEIKNDIKMKVDFIENLTEQPVLTERISRNQLSARRSRTLKRSLSESAASDYISAMDSFKECDENNFMYAKRTKADDSEILVESNMIDENYSNVIHGNRRNSISTIYNDENVSFCIVIDNDCVLTEENEDCPKVCFTEVPGDCLTTLCTEAEVVNSESTEVISCEDTEQYEYGNEFILHNIDDRSAEETWVEDVACMETVFNDDIAEDIVISAPSSPTVYESSEDESVNIESGYNVSENEHTNKVKHIYGNVMCDDDAQLVEKLYRTPQMEVNRTLIDKKSQLQSDEYNKFYDNESLEKVLSESNIVDTHFSLQNDTLTDKSFILSNDSVNDVHGNKENLNNVFLEQLTKNETMDVSVKSDKAVQSNLSDEKQTKNYDDYSLVNSCEFSCNTFVPYKKEEEKLHYAISSSPEVSSTTSEEKGSAILLKIRSYKGTKISEINDMASSFNQTNNAPISRPLITKAAQKYIPPLKETIRDLKVKLHLPKQSLYKLQQLKKSKEEPKINTSPIKHYVKISPHEYQKKSKPKPKFEDVLKSIDEIQFKKHKEKNKKSKQTVPKVIIKKNENGAHYASTQSKEKYNPDLTGRKWQPWVFIEKNNFIDKMAVKQKLKAVYSHRKKSYVLAESFRKYKSISNSNFVISHPKTNDNLSSGKLKYTFRLKHN